MKKFLFVAITIGVILIVETIVYSFQHPELTRMEMFYDRWYVFAYAALVYLIAVMRKEISKNNND